MEKKDNISTLEEIKNKKTITIHEAAIYLSISDSGLRKILNEQKLGACIINIGKKRMINKTKLDEYLDSHTWQ